MITASSLLEAARKAVEAVPEVTPG
jgi:hypothetical protein